MIATYAKALLAITGLLTIASAAAGDTTNAVVVGTHSAQSTQSFAAARGIPDGQAKGGYYAVVRLLDGRARGSAFALVYVPPNIKVRQDDRVEIAASNIDLVAEPGKGVVLGKAGELATVH